MFRMRTASLGLYSVIAALAITGVQISASQAATRAVLECDRYAASNNDTATTAGLAGVRFQDLDPAMAKPACEAAYAENPDIGRFAFQLARVEVKLENYERARVLLEEAVEKGYTLAAVELGLLYDTGRGMAADYGKAMELYQLAADDGWAVALSNVGDLYRLGLGVDKDLEKALGLFERAIAGGNEAALGRKAMVLGELYKEGDDPRPVVTALLQAASRNEPNGSVDLGLAYLNGRYGLPVDPIAAFTHLTRGYDLGDPWGGIYLAQIEIARWDGDLQRADSVKLMLEAIAQGTADGPRAQALALLGQLGFVVGAPRVEIADLIERAWAIDPEDDIVLNARANLMVANDNFAEADVLMQKAAESAPDWAPYYARRSIIQLKLGNAELSKELEDRANAAKDGQYFLQFIGR